MSYVLFLITGFKQLPKEMSITEALLQESRIEVQMDILKEHHMFIAQYHDKVEALLWACVVFRLSYSFGLHCLFGILLRQKVSRDEVRVL